MNIWFYLDVEKSLFCALKISLKPRQIFVNNGLTQHPKWGFKGPFLVVCERKESNEKMAEPESSW